MSTLETILSRMMSESAFAEAVLADAEHALAGYNLSAAEIEKFKSLTQVDFEALVTASPEARQSMAVGNYFDGRFLSARDLTRDQG